MEGRGGEGGVPGPFRWYSIDGWGGGGFKGWYSERF